MMPALESPPSLVTAHPSVRREQALLLYSQQQLPYLFILIWLKFPEQFTFRSLPSSVIIPAACRAYMLAAGWFMTAVELAAVSSMSLVFEVAALHSPAHLPPVDPRPELAGAGWKSSCLPQNPPMGFYVW